MTVSDTTSLPFPHQELTKIVGKPTNTSLKVLRKEVYANARAVASTRGGGAHGLLGLVMPAATYTTLVGQDFHVPAHPGPTPPNPAGATAAVIAEHVRVFNSTLEELKIIQSVRVKIKAQILVAVNPLYLSTLEDEIFGYADVEIAAMLTHLQDTYGTVTRDELETNRANIATCWNVDEPIEQLWLALREIRRIASDGHEALSDKTVIDLTYKMFQKTGVFTTACDTWRTKPEADKTLTNLTTHFNEENKERLLKLNLAQTGFHGANVATQVTPAPPSGAPVLAAEEPQVLVAPAAANAAAAAQPHVICDAINMYYCWTHGLGTNPEHTSATCTRPQDGHIREATIVNRQGGNNRIMTARPRRLNLEG